MNRPTIVAAYAIVMCIVAASMCAQACTTYLPNSPTNTVAAVVSLCGPTVFGSPSHAPASWQSVFEGSAQIWSGCGTAPAIVANGTGNINVDIVFWAGESTRNDGACAQAAPDWSADGVAGGEITIWEKWGPPHELAGQPCTTNWSGLIAHELGHIFGLDNTSCANRLMGDAWHVLSAPAADECTAVDARWDETYGDNECPTCGDGDGPQPWTGGESPIIIDVLGNGYDLTSVQAGVDFDISPGGRIERTAWTHVLSDDAFLVLDRDGDGFVTSGAELFGNHTHQPHSTEPNGFTALRVFDSAEAGGNGDALITSSDAVFSALRLWTDVNHNGVSEPHELASLTETGVETIDLSYRTARRQDRHGNVFRFRAVVTFSGCPHSPRWAYDVFFVVE